MYKIRIRLVSKNIIPFDDLDFLTFYQLCIDAFCREWCRCVQVSICFNKWCTEILKKMYRSLRPLYVALVDPDSTENLRQLREKLSQNITEVINEIGPKVFSDFDPDNVFRNDSTSQESVSELAEGGRTFSQIAGEFLTGTAKVLLDDSKIFNWTKQDEESDPDELLYFLDKSGTANNSAATSDAESALSISPAKKRNRSKLRE